MNQQLFSNRTAGIVLAAAITTTGALSITLSPASAALLPVLANGDYCDLYLTQAGASETSYEVVRATAVNTGTGVVTLGQRAVEGTAATWAIGDKCEMRMTSKYINGQSAKAAGNLSPLSLGNYSPTVTVANNPLYAALRTKMNTLKAGGGTGVKGGFIGDSTTAAYRANNTSNANGCRPFNIAQQVAAAMNSLSVPAQADSFWGDNGMATPAALALYDTRITIGAFTVTLADISPGGNYLRSQNAGEAMVFKPNGLCDTFDAYFLCDTATGSFAMSRSGDSPSGTLSTVSGTKDYKKFTFSGALGNANGLTITNVSGSIFPSGVDAYNSAVPSVRCFNFGFTGGTSTQVAANNTPAASLNAMVKVGLDFAVVRVGINDYLAASIPVATFQANLTTIVSTLQAAGTAVFLQTMNPIKNSSVAYAVQEQYMAAARAVATVQAVYLDDVFQKLGTQETQLGMLMYSEDVHPATPFYQEYGRSIAQMILTA